MTRYLLAVVALLSLAACTTHTDYGDCVGAFDDRDPRLTYKMSAWNIAMGVIFVEMVIPPIYVVADATLCPVGRKPEAVR